jgi:hypothetical protein
MRLLGDGVKPFHVHHRFCRGLSVEITSIIRDSTLVGVDDGDGDGR